ncbi:hypothetical protein SB759_29975, partial [Pseudomonas sp. SIMBA_059]
MTTPANTPAQNSPIPTFDLNDGRPIPQLGLGIYAMKGDEGVDAIVGAVDDVGYRLLDTAVNYENEREVGRQRAKIKLIGPGTHGEQQFQPGEKRGDVSRWLPGDQRLNLLWI